MLRLAPWLLWLALLLAPRTSSALETTTGGSCDERTPECVAHCAKQQDENKIDAASLERCCRTAPLCLSTPPAAKNSSALWLGISGVALGVALLAVGTWALVDKPLLVDGGCPYPGVAFDTRCVDQKRVALLGGLSLGFGVSFAIAGAFGIKAGKK